MARFFVRIKCLFAPDYSLYTTCDSLTTYTPSPGERRSSLGHVIVYTHALRARRAGANVERAE